MEILLHTIVFEPARWTPKRVSLTLQEILPAIARTGLRKLEIYEHHLSMAADEGALLALFSSLNLEPVILSSYFNANPAVTSDEAFETGLQAMQARVKRFGFKKVRLFPGGGINPSDEVAVCAMTKRIATIVSCMPEIEFVLESHDHSIADSPERFVQMVRDIAAPNVGILYQPTVFEPEPAMRQLEVELPWIKHLHLQNRASGEAVRFARLAEGVISWKEIFAKVAASGSEVSATLEFVPSGICPMEQFNLEQTLAEAVEEINFAKTL